MNSHQRHSVREEEKQRNAQFHQAARERIHRARNDDAIRDMVKRMNEDEHERMKEQSNAHTSIHSDAPPENESIDAVIENLRKKNRDTTRLLERLVEIISPKPAAPRRKVTMHAWPDKERYVESEE